jgi:hypothetical protein
MRPSAISPGNLELGGQGQAGVGGFVTLAPGLQRAPDEQPTLMTVRADGRL